MKLDSIIAGTDRGVFVKELGGGQVNTATGDFVFGMNEAYLIENGTISAVGKNLDIPAGTEVLEAEVVIPGLIDMHTHVGVYSLPLVEENEDGNEMTDPITPQVRALDSFNFDDPAIGNIRARRPGQAHRTGQAKAQRTIFRQPDDAFAEIDIVEQVIGQRSAAVMARDQGQLVGQELQALEHVHAHRLGQLARVLERDLFET